MPLQGAAVRVRRALSSLGAGAVQGRRCCRALGTDGVDYIYALSKRERVWLLPKNMCCYPGSMLA